MKSSLIYHLVQRWSAAKGENAPYELDLINFVSGTKAIVGSNNEGQKLPNSIVRSMIRRVFEDEKETLRFVTAWYEQNWLTYLIDISETYELQLEEVVKKNIRVENQIYDLTRSEWQWVDMVDWWVLMLYTALERQVYAKLRNEFVDECYEIAQGISYFQQRLCFVGFDKRHYDEFQRQFKTCDLEYSRRYINLIQNAIKYQPDMMLLLPKKYMTQDMFDKTLQVHNEFHQTLNLNIFDLQFIQNTNRSLLMTAVVTELKKILSTTWFPPNLMIPKTLDIAVTARGKTFYTDLIEILPESLTLDAVTKWRLGWDL